MPDNIVDSLRVKIEGDSRAASNTIDALVADLGKLKTALDGIKTSKVGSLFTPTSAKNANAFADAIDRIDIAKLRELSTIKITNPFSGGNLYGAVTEGFQSTITLLESISTRLGKFSSRQKDVAATTKKATSAIHAQAKAAHSTHKSFSLANTALGKFFNSIKRIAFYRLIRSAIKAITQGFSEGIQNLYFWSQAVGTSFAPAMDRLATATLYLKNGFASMWSPLIEYAIPIIDMVIDKLVDFFNLVQEGFARLVGAPTWNKALKYPVQFAENTDGAAKSAKKLHNILMGFDEMNVINTPNDSGRGSGADEKDYSSMFKLMETGLDDGRGIGQRIADAFNKWINKTDWEGMGKKLSSGINKIVQPIYDFLSGSNWGDLGGGIAGFLDGAIRQIDANLLGNTLVTVFTSAFDLLGGLIAGLAERHTGVALGEKVTEFITAVLGKLAAWVESTDFLKLLDDIATIMGDVVEGLQLDEIEASLEKLVINLVAKLPAFLIKAIKNIGSVPAKMIFKLFGWDDAVTWIEDNVDAPVDAFAKEVDKSFGGYVKNINKSMDALEESRKESKQYTKTLKTLQSTQNVFTTEGLQRELKAAQDTVLGVDDASNVFKTTLDSRIPQALLKAADSAGIEMNRIGNSSTQLTSKMSGNWTTVQEGLDDITNATKNAEKEIGKSYGIIGNQSYLMAKQHKLNMNDAAKATKDAETSIKQSAKGIDNALTNAFTSLGSRIPALARQLGYEIANPFLTATGAIRNMLATIEVAKVQAPKNTGFTSTIASNSLERLLSGRGYATGGYPQLGEPFFMGEGGVPEMLGKVNGRSAVVGGAEITGISDTIRAQGAREERLLETLIGVLERKDFSFTPNAAAGRAINQALRQYAGVTG